MGRLAEIVVRLQENAGALGQQSKPATHIGDVLAAGVDDEIGTRGRVVERIHVARSTPETLLPAGLFSVSRNGRDLGIDVDAVDRFDVEARVVEQHCGQHAVPAAEHPDAPEPPATAFEQLVARPHFAGDLLVIEGGGDIGLRVLGDDARQPCDQRAARCRPQMPRVRSKACSRQSAPALSGWVASIMGVLYVEMSGQHNAL